MAIQADRSRQIVRVSFVGIGANLVLVAFKAAVGLITGSIAVILDAVNNLSDALSSLITIVGTKLANRPPDKKHPYGYGRIEYITSVIIAVIVIAAGVTSFRESFEKILHPSMAEYTPISLIIIGAAVAVKLALGQYVKRAGKRLNSESLVASGTDAFFDAIISLSTLAAAAVSMIWEVSVEGYLGAVISLVIVKAGVEILLESLNSIIGTRADTELSTRLKERICAFPEVRGAYDLILHRYGPEKTIGSVHVEVSDSLTARELHRLTRRITMAVYLEYGIILTVGIYAANDSEGDSAAIRADVDALAAARPEILQTHGFYVEPETRHVSVDVIVAFGADAPAIRQELIAALSEKYPDHTFDVLLDSDFSD